LTAAVLVAGLVAGPVQATAQHVLDLGVTGIISDDPDMLIAVARRNGLR